MATTKLKALMKPSLFELSKSLRSIGTIKNTTPIQVQKALENAFGKIKHRPTTWGYELEWTTDSIELYISSHDECEFNVDLTFEGSQEDLESSLYKLKNNLMEFAPDFEIWYYETDEADEQISDDILFYKS